MVRSRASRDSPRTENHTFKIKYLAVRPELVEGGTANYDTVSEGGGNYLENSKYDGFIKSLKWRFLSFLRKQESSIFIWLKFPGFPYSPVCQAQAGGNDDFLRIHQISLAIFLLNHFPMMVTFS
jgi:hypothetical protein